MAGVGIGLSPRSYIDSSDDDVHQHSPAACVGIEIADIFRIGFGDIIHSNFKSPSIPEVVTLKIAHGAGKRRSGSPLPTRANSPEEVAMTQLEENLNKILEEHQHESGLHMIGGRRRLMDRLVEFFQSAEKPAKTDQNRPDLHN